MKTLKNLTVAALAVTLVPAATDWLCGWFVIAGATLVLMPRWDRELAGRLISRYRVTTWTNIPTMVIDLLASQKQGAEALKAYRESLKLKPMQAGVHTAVMTLLLVLASAYCLHVLAEYYEAAKVSRPAP